ncbi:MAG: M48 family metalloprotease [Hydrogenophilus thermoluteolus]
MAHMRYGEPERGVATHSHPSHHRSMRRRFVGFLGLAVSGVAGAFQLPDLSGSSATVFSAQEEAAVGRAAMREIRERDPSYWDDPALAEYLTGLTQQLAAGLTGRLDVPVFTAFLLKDWTINAFALPGGYLGFHAGLIAATESEAELAAVAAHEVAHVAQHHIAQMLEQQKGASLWVLGSLLIAALAARSGTGQLPEAAAAAGSAAAAQQQLAFSRAFERDADRVGLELLARAGFAPEGAVRFFGRLLNATRLGETGFPPYLRTHPLTIERIADLDNRIQSGEFRARFGSAGKEALDPWGFAFVRGTVLAERGTAGEALAQARAAAQDPVGQVWRVRAALRAGERAAAKEWLVRFVQQWPEGRWRALWEAEAWRALGNLAEALAVLRRALSAQPESLALRAAAVRTAIAAGEREWAWQQAREGVERYPKRDLAWRLLGEVAAARGDQAWQHRAQGERFALDERWQAALDQFEKARLARREDDIWVAEVQVRANRMREAIRAEQRERGRSVR